MAHVERRRDPDGAGGPLHGVRVVELGRYIAAPLAARLLADWGAEVIKIEPPEGDPMRWGLGGDRPGFSPVFASFNRGKRSVTLDLKSAAGRAALRALLADSDALVHNLRPAALGRLGIDPDTLVDELPRLITCGVNGFGADGPFAESPTFDAIVSAAGGLYAQFAALEDLEPTGPPWSDLLAGMYAAQAVMAALVARERGGARGGGQVIGVSMLESLLGGLDDSFTTWFEAGQALGPRSRQARQHVFVCQSADDRPLVVQLGSAERAWQSFAQLVAPGLADDPRFATYSTRATNFEALSAAVAAATATRPRDEWLAELAVRDISAGPVNTIAEAAVDERALAVDAFVDVAIVDGPPLRTTRPVGRFSSTEVGPVGPPPAAGEHTLDVISGLGLDRELATEIESTWTTRRTTRTDPRR